METKTKLLTPTSSGSTHNANTNIMMEDYLGSNFSFVLPPTQVAVSCFCNLDANHKPEEISWLHVFLFGVNHAPNPFQDRAEVLNLNRRGQFQFCLPNSVGKEPAGGRGGINVLTNPSSGQHFAL